MTDNDTAVARLPVKAPTGPLPTMPSVDVVQALTAYREIQVGLDAALGESAMVRIGDKRHRTKTYWNAIGCAFQLELEIVREDFERMGDPCEHCLNSEDWGYIVTVVATAADGHKSFGDGACFASEKTVYQTRWESYRDDRGKPRNRKVEVLDSDGRPSVDLKATRDSRTLHNVRSTAMTRARNRAISNLVGFGEVSAEELPRDGQGGAQEPPPSSPPAEPPAQRSQNGQKPAEDPMATQADYQALEVLWREKLPGVRYETLYRQSLGGSPRKIEGGGGVFERLSQSQMQVMLAYLREYTAHEREPDVQKSGGQDQCGTGPADAESAGENGGSAS
jgi:hypothetical protein